MSDYKAYNAPNRLSAGALPQTPLGELTALPRPSRRISGGLILKGRGRDEMGKEGRGG